MAVEIRVPSLGESIVEATISQWLKQEGDTVAAGEPLLEIETDKVNLEIPAEQAGVLVSIAKAEGETVTIGDVLGIVDGASEQGQGQPPSASEQGRGQPVPPAEQGYTTSASGQDGQGQGNGGDASPPPALQPQPAQQPTTADEAQATPVALQMASENEVDIQQVQGSGAGGRVTKEDVLEHMLQQKARERIAEPPPRPASSAGQRTDAQSAVPPQERVPSPAPSAPATPAAPTAPTHPVGESGTGRERREERVRMSRRRQTIARRLVEAQHTAAMLTTFNEVDLGAVVDIRKRRREQFKELHGVSLGFMSFFVKACIGALKAFPMLNAEIQGDEIVIKHYYDLGIAVGTEQGLVVPVLRDADRKTFAQIEQGIADLARRTRDNTLTLEDLQGGTFSITNGGIYGSLMSTPILNTPQVGILGMHKIEERPVVINSEIVVRPMMYLALSYDHRIVDGSVAVRFLVRIKEMLEDPETLLLEG
jgi:2-oxoglutarate dehydrogenase E2 component (dihydrolipoamide succinyltransferase)